MKMRPGTQTGFLLCGKEWNEGEELEVHSPWDHGVVGRVTLATRGDARQAVNHAVASIRRTRALPRWKRREILEDVTAALIEQKERFANLIVAEAGKPVRLARAQLETLAIVAYRQPITGPEVQEGMASLRQKRAPDFPKTSPV